MHGWHISRFQLGVVAMTVGLAVLVAIPGVYAAAHSSSHRAWWWPTWWMLAPLAVLIIGAVLMIVERRSDADADAETVTFNDTTIDGEDFVVDSTADQIASKSKIGGKRMFIRHRPKGGKADASHE